MKNQASRLDALQKRLHYHFLDQSLLNQALVHRSYAHENPHLEQEDNENLEFLGDAVLGLVISHLLYEGFPHYREGDLSRLRSSIVNEKELAQLAEKLQLGSCLMLGKGEELTGGRHKPSLLADTLEALLAAVFLDGGLEAVTEVVQKLFRRYLHPKAHADPLKELNKDFKTQLQELTQARFRITPTYVLETEVGPDHAKTFYVSVVLDGEVLAQGSGKSKKEAQQQAAKIALGILDEESCNPEC